MSRPRSSPGCFAGRERCYGYNDRLQITKYALVPRWEHDCLIPVFLRSPALVNAAAGSCTSSGVSATPFVPLGAGTPVPSVVPGTTGEPGRRFSCVNRKAIVCLVEIPPVVGTPAVYGQQESSRLPTTGTPAVYRGTPAVYRQQVLLPSTVSTDNRYSYRVYRRLHDEDIFQLRRGGNVLVMQSETSQEGDQSETSPRRFGFRRQSPTSRRPH